MTTDGPTRHPPDCPQFEYACHRHRSQLLSRVEHLILDLRKNPGSGAGLAGDTRPAHQILFQGLTPALQPYYAGHYRGESFRCLQHYNVFVPGDPRVGANPADVNFLMLQLASAIASNFNALDRGSLSPLEQFRYLLRFACTVFVQFLTTHPYANGNGHAARLLIWCILGRYGYWPQRWSIEPRPADPPYSDLIKRYRDGDKQPLELFVASMLSPL